MNIKLGLTLCLVAAGAAVGFASGCSSPNEATESTASVQQALLPCDPASPFNPPVAAFTGTMVADGITFSQDGLKAYVSGKLGSATTYNVYVATRPSTGVPFQSLTAVPGLDTAFSERTPSLSGDGTMLYFAKIVGRANLMVSTIDSSGVVGTPVAMSSAFNGSLHDQDPFFLASTNELYFAKEPEDGQRDLMVSQYTSSTGTYSTPTTLALSNSTDDEYRPILSPDGLTLYFTSTRSGIVDDTGGDIWTVKRTSTGVPFPSSSSQIRNLYTLNTQRIERPAGISNDGCTLYFASNRDTSVGSDFRLYQATRGTDVPATITTTIKIVGDGSIITPPYQCSTTCSFEAAPDAIIYVEASAQAIWSGSCVPWGGGTSGDGAFVFTNGGTCTVTFPSGLSGPGGGCFSANGCESGLVCMLNVCRCEPGSPNCPCTPSCASNACGAEDGCGGYCPCEPGEPCFDDSDCGGGARCCGDVCGGEGCDCAATSQCASGLNCFSGTCSSGPPPTPCATNPPGSGVCARGEPCSDVADCAPGLTCGRGQGFRFGSSSPDVCIAPTCVSRALSSPDCGSVESMCGLCPQCLKPAGCTPQTIPFTLPLPENEVAGAIGGDFQVSGSGTATYAIDIPLPPGRGDMTPALGLSYDSSQRAELLGAGWGISGFSYITLCNTPMKARFRLEAPGEGYVSARRGVRGQGDQLCIDGVPMQQDVEGECPNCKLYRTIPNSFRRIRGFGDLGGYPEYFEVSTPEGQTHFYGQGEANVQIDLGTGKRRVWARNRIQDQVGNFIMFDYLAHTGQDLQTIPPLDCTSGGYLCGTTEIFPTQIRYTGFSDGQVELAPNRAVVFNYSEEPLGDPVTGYAAGIITTRTRMLAGIDIKIRDEIVRSYRLETLLGDNGVAELRKLWECFPELDDPNAPTGPTHDKCLKPTTFEYYAGQGLDSTPVDSGVTFTPSQLLPPNAQFIVHDANGDGRDDLLTAGEGPIDNHWIRFGSTGAGFTKLALSVAQQPRDLLAPQFTQASVGDYNRDGYDDIFDVALRGNQNARVLMGGPGALQQEEILETTSGPAAPPLNIPLLYYFQGVDVHFTDFDGDGRTDFVLDKWIPGGGQQAFAYWRRGLSDGTFEEAGDEIPSGPYFPIDLDGDQLADLARATGPQAAIAVNWDDQAPQPFVDYLGLAQVPGYLSPPEVTSIDINGDGLKDILTRRTFTDPGGFYLPAIAEIVEGPVDVLLHINTGAGFRQAINVGPMTYQEFQSIRVLDYDGDGNEDALRWSGGAWVLLRGRESGFQEPDVLNLTTPLVYTYNLYNPANNLYGYTDHPWSAVADVDGDGALDFIVVSQQGRLMIHRSIVGADGGRTAVSNMLKAVTTGLGERTEIDYENPADPAYSPGPRMDAFEDAPECDLVNCLARPGKPLVRAVRTSARVGEGYEVAQSQRYAYEDARADARGRGWLGFSHRSIETYDKSENLLRRTDYSYGQAFQEMIYFDLGGDWFSPDGYLQGFPFAGLPTVVGERYPTVPGTMSSAARHSVRLVQNEWSGQSTNDLFTWFPALLKRTTRELDFEIDIPDLGDLFDNVQQLSSVEESFLHDDYGNLTTREVWTSKTSVGGSHPVEHEVETTTFEYDEDSWLLRSPLDSVTERTRADQLVTLREDFTGDTVSQTVHYGHDPLGQLTEITRVGETLTTKFTRNQFGNVTQVDRFAVPDGSTRTTAIDDYDADEIFPTHLTVEPDVASKLEPGDLPLEPHEFTHAYDERFGVLTSVTDPNDLEEKWGYDSFGRLTRHERPDGSGETIVRDFSDVDAAGVLAVAPVLKTTTTLDGGGQTTVEIDSLGRDVRRRSLAIETVPANGNAVTSEVIQELSYDDAGRLSHVARPHLPGHTSQGVVTYQYNALDELTAMEHPDGVVTYDRIELAQLSATQVAALAPRAHDWLVVSRRDAKLGLETKMFDVAGQLTAVIDAAGTRVNYDYDGMGRLLAMTGPRGSVVRTYDGAGRVQTLTDPDRGYHEYTYTVFDELFTHTVTDYGTETFRYDPFGRAKRVENADGIARWEYDQAAHGIGALSREIVEAGAASRYGNSVAYAYDTRGRLESRTHEIRGDSYVVGLNYTNQGRLSVVDYPSAGGEVFRVEQVYDPASGLVQEVRDADNTARSFWRLQATHEGVRVGTERVGPVVTTVHDYFETTGLPERITSQVGSTTIQEEAYTFDANRNLETRDDVLRPDGFQRFIYDPLNRVRQVLDVNSSEIERIDIDGAGNIVNKSGVGTYSYDDPTGACDPAGVAAGVRPHAVTRAGSRCFKYDGAGNQIYRSGPAGEQVLKYTLFGLPHEIVRGTGSQADITELDYSAGGRRVLKSLLRPGPTSDPGDRVATAFSAYVEELYEQRADCTNASGDCTDPQRSHLYRVYAAGREVAEVRRAEDEGVIASEEVQYLHADQLGSVAVVTDADSTPGTVVKKQRFSPFGTADVEVAGAPMLTTGFAGLEEDSDSGLVNMRGRLYDPDVGRFISPDPVTPVPDWTQGLNRYTYGLNNPLRVVDPSGFTPTGAPPQQQVQDPPPWLDLPRLSPDERKRLDALGKRRAQRATPRGVGPKIANPDPAQPGAGQGGKSEAPPAVVPTDGPPAVTPGTAGGEPQAKGDSPPGKNTTMGKIAAGTGLVTGSPPSDVRTDGTGHGGGVPGGLCSVGCFSGPGVQGAWVAAMLFGNRVVDYAVGKLASAASRLASAGKTLLASLDSAVERALGNEATKKGASAVRPLVYGPTAGGRLAGTAESLGGQTLNDLGKPMEMGWEAFSKQTLDAAAASGRPVIFDLTNMKNIPGVLNGTGEFADTVTGFELRYLQANWRTFQGNVTFMSGGVPVGVPW